MSKKQTITEARVDQLVPSALNPRRTFDERALEELAASLKADGVLQSLLVRPRPADPDTLEIVCGERRWRAAKLAGLEVVPVRVRHDLAGDDLATIEAMITENSQRADVPPLEEADAYAELVERGRTPAAIAAKLGRTEGYVRARLRLCALGPRAREPLARGLLTLGAALALASVEERDQDAVIGNLEEDFGWRYDGQQPGIAGVAHVQAALRGVVQDLARAPWDLADEALVPSAGSCARCPKRTGAQTDLWGESRDDRCLDTACWQAKADALVAVRVGAGARLIEGGEASKVLGYQGRVVFNSGLVGLADQVHLDPTEVLGHTPTWRELLAGQELPLTVIRSDEGDLVEAVDEWAAYEAIRERFPKSASWKLDRGPSGGAGDDEDWKERQRKAAFDAKVRAETQRRAIEELVDLMLSGRGFEAEDLRTLALLLLRQTWSESVTRVAERRGWKAEGGKESAVEMLNATLDGMGEGELLTLMAEVLVTSACVHGGHITDGLSSKPVSALMFSWGVDVKAITKEVKRDLSPKKKAKKAKPDEGGAPKRKKCSSCGQHGHNARGCLRRGADAEPRA